MTCTQRAWRTTITALHNDPLVTKDYKSTSLDKIPIHMCISVCQSQSSLSAFSHSLRVWDIQCFSCIVIREFEVFSGYLLCCVLVHPLPHVLLLLLLQHPWWRLVNHWCGRLREERYWRRLTPRWPWCRWAHWLLATPHDSFQHTLPLSFMEDRKRRANTLDPLQPTVCPIAT